jgi:hypothetical protein
MMRASGRFVLAWAAMSALTLAAIPLGGAASAGPLGPALTIALLLVTFLKARVLLAHYLELAHAPEWNRALSAALLALLAILAALALLARPA